MHNKLSKVWLTRADECFQVNFPPKKLWREVSKSNGSNITLASQCALFLSFPSFLPLSRALHLFMMYALRQSLIHCAGARSRLRTLYNEAVCCWCGAGKERSHHSEMKTPHIFA
jgi:hypothetical protein